METALQRVEGNGKLSLVRKLAEVMAAVERVPKSGRNDFHRYDYATEADIVAAVRVAMAERQVIMIPTVVDKQLGEVARAKGGTDRLCTLTVRFTLHDGESGEQLAFDIIGEGQDAGDKSFYKAMTGAVKYALLKLFLIPTGDEPEEEATPPKGKGTAPGTGDRSRHADASSSASKAPGVQSPSTEQSGGAKAGTVVLFGPHKDKRITELGDTALQETISFGLEKLKAAKPADGWTVHVRANLAALNAEAELRLRAKPAAPPAAPPVEDDVPF